MKTRLFNTINLLAIVVLFGFGAIYAQNSENQVRTKTNINSDWKYLENDAENLFEIANTGNWLGINLPHSWNSQDATDNEPGYRRSASWYKKNLVFESIDANKIYQLYFEGSNITTKVYINGKEAGGHIGGYIGFYIDITKFINVWKQ
jgi:beta-galactosidase